jgi:hypothetical protein
MIYIHEKTSRTLNEMSESIKLLDLEETQVYSAMIRDKNGTMIVFLADAYVSHDFDFDEEDLNDYDPKIHKKTTIGIDEASAIHIKHEDVIKVIDSGKKCTIKLVSGNTVIVEK